VFCSNEERATGKGKRAKGNSKNKNTSLLEYGRRGIDTFKATHLNTDSFNLNDINLLQVALKDKFFLRIRLIKFVKNKGRSLYQYDKYNH